MVALVQTPDEQLRDLSWPELEQVDQISLALEDWLVICAGFEERALGVLKNAIRTQTVFRVLLILYRPLLRKNREGEIRRICNEAGIRPVEVIYDRKNLAGFDRILLEKLSAVRGRLLVDISAMSRLLITQVLVALGTRPQSFQTCSVAYAEARSYPPDRKKAEAKLKRSEADPTFAILFLSSGVFEVTALPELSSFAMAGAQTRLITFPSLDAHHLIALRTELQPSRFSFLEGVPPKEQNRWRQDFISRLNRLDDIQGAERHGVSTLDYRETIRCLLKIYAQYGIRERLLLSPTGSKMQTVAAGIFRSWVRDVQIVYPTSRGFRSPSKYTLGVEALYLLPLEVFARDEPSTA